MDFTFLLNFVVVSSINLKNRKRFFRRALPAACKAHDDSILPEQQNIMFPLHTKKAPKLMLLGAFPWLFIILLLVPGSQQPGSPGYGGDPTV